MVGLLLAARADKDLADSRGKTALVSWSSQGGSCELFFWFCWLVGSRRLTMLHTPGL